MANLGDRERANQNYSLDELDTQLISYLVTDSQGVVRGKVADIYRDAQNKVHLLIELSDPVSAASWYGLHDRHIVEINTATKTIVTNLSRLELTELPPYRSLSSSLEAVNEVASERSNSFPNTEAQTIPLLEEKLTVKRRKRKVGEIVVRKEIETRLVQIPIRSEKLVVERTGANPEVLTEVDLVRERVSITDAAELAVALKSKFVSIPTAREILQILEREAAADTKIRLEIITDDKMQRDRFRAVCDRFSQSS